MHKEVTRNITEDRKVFSSDPDEEYFFPFNEGVKGFYKCSAISFRFIYSTFILSFKLKSSFLQHKSWLEHSLCSLPKRANNSTNRKTFCY